MKERLDKLLAASGLVPSRERAQALIVAGRVLVDEQKVEKAGTLVASSAQLRILGEQQRYVSRGGLKLEHALTHWQIALNGLHCLDIGASTGGFTDCMLQHDAASVLAVDTGYGQIAHSVRTNPRLSLMERTNARNLKPGELAGRDQLPGDGCFLHLGHAGSAGRDRCCVSTTMPARKRRQGRHPGKATV